MSTKATLKFVSTDEFGFHLYVEAVGGHFIDIRYRQFCTTFPIDKETADDIVKQIEKGNN